MRSMTDTAWARRGISMLWDGDAMGKVSNPNAVLSMRQLFHMQGSWPEDLPGFSGNALVVAGLEGSLDALTPGDATFWLADALRPVVLSFQSFYGLEAALIFWLPGGRTRIRMNSANETYSWICAGPYSSHTLDIGHVFWSGAADDVVRILNADATGADIDGKAWIGIHLARLS